jgi:GDP-mannose 6-dehydrogenase
VLESILPSNQLQVQKVLKLLTRLDKRRVGMIGLSFKPNTDDLRESPAVELAERLIGKGFELSIYDREVSLSRLHGSNRAYIDRVIPHIGSLLQSSLEETVEAAEVVVVTQRLPEDEQRQLLDILQPEQTLIDLVRLDGRGLQEFDGEYHGIAW